MEVTCERCGTVYDFDDALVSERGTSVKCTTCGHQFKVRRASMGTVPDTWVVRTVDGREIEFSALRELQGAIHDGKVSREDVLSRGNSRPRRLGSIAELEPFFSRIGMTVPGTGTTPPPPAARTRTRTPAGLGGGTAPPPRQQEASVVFALPGRQPQAAAPAAAPAGPRRGSVPPPPPVAMGGALLGRRSPSVRPPAAGADDVPGLAAPRVPGGLEELNTMDVVEAPISTRTNGNFGAAPPMRGQAGSTPDERGGTVERISQLPPPPPPPRKPAGSSPMFPPPAPAEGPPLPRKTAPSSPMFPPPEPPPPPRKPAASAPMFPPPEAPPPPRKATPEPPSVQDEGPSSGEDPTLMMERPPTSEGPTLMMDRPPSLTAAKAAPPKAASATPAPPKSEPTKPASAPSVKNPSSGPASLPPSSAFPSGEDVLSVSGVPPRRPHAARWIVGVLLLGVGALGVVMVAREYLPNKGAATQPQGDARLGALLDQGDRDLRDGDLDAANESYVKASAIADADLRVAVRLARLSAVRADVAWLKVRLLSASDPDGPNAKRELDLVVGRAKQAADRAQSIAAADADVTRARIDALRLAGDVDGARKLVASLPKSTPQASDELLFATLDLAEPAPVWATVIERLKNAARDEQNLGRARSMLIYALARSGDAAGAKAELDRLAAMPRPHPLVAPLRAFVSRAEGAAKKPEVEAASLKVEAGGDALATAIEAIEKGELDKAEGLLKELAEKSPKDTKVLKAEGDLASKKRDRAAAIRFYEQAVAADGTNLDAIAALADLRWENGERMTASTLYRKIIEKGGDASPHTKRAKQRLAQFADAWEPQ